MDSDLPSPAKLIAAHLAIIVGVIHLSMGLLEWFRYVYVGIILPPDLRWPLFVLSGFALLGGVFIAAMGRHRRSLYVGGILLMLVYILGYFGWHVGGHRGLLVVGKGAPHHGPMIPYLIDHLFAGPVEFLALVTEATLAVILVYLLIQAS